MSNERGVYGKYILGKADGSSVDPDACYFVLRLDTDKAARAAMRVYAKACGNTNLADDINACLDYLDDPPLCTCGGRGEVYNCPVHDSMYQPVWRHGDTELLGHSEMLKKCRKIARGEGR
jgi:hypothetical protein